MQRRKNTDEGTHDKFCSVKKLQKTEFLETLDNVRNNIFNH